MSGPAWLAFLGAAVGAPARYLLDGWVQRRASGPFPIGTLVVNVSGCLVLGAVTGLGLYHGADATLRLVVGTGGLGAYTTFSTFSVETVRLAEEGRPGDAVRNVAGTLVLGLAAAALGLGIVALA